MRHGIFRRRRGESLIESLIAISVIAISTAAAMTLIRTSLIGNTVIGEKIIALNLALEGVEAVRNIRDTNYLKFPNDPENCWNALGAEEEIDCPFEQIQEGTTYYMTRNLVAEPLFEWGMAEVTLPIQGWLSLYEFDVDGLLLDLYGQSGVIGPGITTVRDQVFYRTVEVDYLPPAYDAFDVKVTVTWDVRGQDKEISLTRTIANIY